jgi:hypothetical protein
MDVNELWTELIAQYPSRVARVSDQIAPNSSDLQTYLDHLHDMKKLATFGNDKCGTIGNPYEKPAEDLAILLEAAERISGQKSRFSWERN